MDLVKEGSFKVDLVDNLKVLGSLDSQEVVSSLDSQVEAGSLDNLKEDSFQVVLPMVDFQITTFRVAEIVVVDYIEEELDTLVIKEAFAQIIQVLLDELKH